MIAGVFWFNKIAKNKITDDVYNSDGDKIKRNNNISKNTKIDNNDKNII